MIVIIKRLQTFIISIIHTLSDAKHPFKGSTGNRQTYERDRGIESERIQERPDRDSTQEERNERRTIHERKSIHERSGAFDACGESEESTRCQGRKGSDSPTETRSITNKGLITSIPSFFSLFIAKLRMSWMVIQIIDLVDSNPHYAIMMLKMLYHVWRVNKGA